jgi:ABC-2 type transport system permease protein
VTGRIRAELLKVRSTRMWIGLLAGALAFVALNLVAQLFAPASQGAPGLGTQQGMRSLWASAGSGSIFALLLGVTAMTAEYRFKTISITFIATPRRAQVVLAKIGALAVVGFLFAVSCAVLALVLALSLLPLKDHAVLPASTIAAILVGAIVGSTLYAVIGVAVGSLVTNQIAATLGALIWVILIEGLIVAFLPSVGKWLPGGAANSMLQMNAFGHDLLNPWLGALVFCGYAVVFVVVATQTTLRRDIT